MTDVDDLPAAVLQAAGLHDDGLVPRHGWSNRAWVGPLAAVRVSSGRLPGSFEHEVEVLHAIDGAGVPTARVVDHGSLSGLRPGVAGEWIVSHTAPGSTLAEAWPDLDDAGRRPAGTELGRALLRLHAWPVPDLAPRWWREAQHPDRFQNAYRPPVWLGPALAAAAADLPDSDAALLADVHSMLVERLSLFAGDVLVFAHGDVHGHNILVDDNGTLTALLDWEGAHHASADLELDMLLRWTAAAHDFPESPGGPCRIRSGDALALIDHVAAAYAGLFAVPHLRERLEVYDAHWHLVHLFCRVRLALGDPAWPAEVQLGPLRRLLAGQSHLDLFHL